MDSVFLIVFLLVVCALCIYPYYLVIRLLQLACKALKKYISE